MALGCHHLQGFAHRGSGDTEPPTQQRFRDFLPSADLARDKDFAQLHEQGVVYEFSGHKSIMNSFFELMKPFIGFCHYIGHF